MIIRSAKVPLSPSSALQTMYFCGAAVVGDGLPLDPGREARAAAAAQAGGGRPRRRCPRARASIAPPQALPAAVRRVVVERQRVGDAAAGEGQPGLPGEERDRLDRADRLRMRDLAGGRARRERPHQRLAPAAVERAEAVAPARRPRPRPAAPARACPREPLRTMATSSPARRAASAIADGHRLGAAGDRRRIARDEDAPGHADDLVEQQRRAVRRSSRPTTRPSTIADGPVAQSPRQ